MLIAVLCDVVSVAMVSVCVVPADAAVRFIVTPEMALVTELVELLAAIPPTVNSASWANPLCVQALLEFADVIDDWPPVVLAVEVTPRLDRPVSDVTLLVETLMTLAAPVFAARSTRWAPSVPVTMVAVTPGLLLLELIADAMPESVLLVLSTLMSIDLPPSETVSVPVPSCVVAPKAAEDNACELAICVTATE